MKNFYTLPITVYTADTDVTGVVYHANYLKYFEQCRSSWLAHIKLPFSDLIKIGTIFAIKNININYKIPLVLGQTVTCTASIKQNKPCSILFYQTIVDSTDNNIIYCNAEILVASLDANFKPKKTHSILRGLTQ